MRWWTARKLLLVALALPFLGAGLGLACQVLNRSANRAAYLGYYRWALDSYLFEAPGQAVPDDIEQLVREYTSLVDQGMVPPVSVFPRPELRVVREPGDGPFLVLIESPPLKWYDRGRWVIYTDSTYRQVGMRRVSPEDLPRLRAEDDELRRKARAAATSSAPAEAE